VSQESVVQTSDRRGRGTGRLSIFPSCHCYSLTVTDNRLSFVFRLHLRRRKVRRLAENRVVRAVQPSPVCGEKPQTLRQPLQGAGPSPACCSPEPGPCITPSPRSSRCPPGPCRALAGCVAEDSRPIQDCGSERLLCSLGDAGGSTRPCLWGLTRRGLALRTRVGAVAGSRASAAACRGGRRECGRRVRSRGADGSGTGEAAAAARLLCPFPAVAAGSAAPGRQGPS